MIRVGELTRHASSGLALDLGDARLLDSANLSGAVQANVYYSRNEVDKW
jgi:hypothetical protein